MPETLPFQSTFFTVEQCGTVAVVTVNRVQLTDEDNLEQFGQDFHLLIEKLESSKLILKLGVVRYMTSSAIGKLITLHRRVNRSGGALVLCELTRDVQATLEAAKLLTYFTCCQDMDSALVMFES